MPALQNDLGSGMRQLVEVLDTESENETQQQDDPAPAAKSDDYSKLVKLCESDSAAAKEEFERLFPLALVVPGVKHICHNASADVMHSMPGFPCFFKWLKNIEPLLSHPWFGP